MAQVNPQLTDVLSTLAAMLTGAHDDSIAVQGKLDEQIGQLGFIGAQTEFVSTNTGTTAEILVGVAASLVQHTGLLTEIRDTLMDMHALQDVMNTNNSVNAQQIITLLELMLNNNSANAQAIITAVCGDCEPVLPPIESGGAVCRTSTGGNGANATVFTSNIIWYVSPEITGEIGDTVRFRLVSVTREPTSVTLFENGGQTGTPHALFAGSDYVEFVLTSTASSLRFEFPTSGGFQYVATVCVIPAPE